MKKMAYTPTFVVALQAQRERHGLRNKHDECVKLLGHSKCHLGHPTLRTSHVFDICGGMSFFQSEASIRRSRVGYCISFSFYSILCKKEGIGMQKIREKGRKEGTKEGGGVKRRLSTYPLKLPSFIFLRSCSFMSIFPSFLPFFLPRRLSS